MFTKIMKLLVITGSASLFATASAEVVHPELPIETSDVSITQAKPGGFIMARQCKTCPLLSLQFDEKSKAIKHGKSVSLRSIPTHSDSGITIIYDPATKIVHRVTW